ncbi:MAG: AbiH family protein, partial [Ruminococcus sp.]
MRLLMVRRTNFKSSIISGFLGFIGGLDLSNLYVLGNGFDLAHGLKTRYWDFRTFLDKNHSEFLTEFEK